MERYDTDKLHPTTLGVRNFLENSRVSHAILKILAVLGVSLIMADGILTPAQSVLGAIQGEYVLCIDTCLSPFAHLSRLESC
jgi:KUP system potassium uptake protein